MLGATTKILSQTNDNSNTWRGKNHSVENDKLCTFFSSSMGQIPGKRPFFQTTTFFDSECFGVKSRLFAPPKRFSIIKTRRIPIQGQNLSRRCLSASLIETECTYETVEVWLSHPLFHEMRPAWKKIQFLRRTRQYWNTTIGGAQ